ncbi:hypothetical protein SERLA73DRAFT_147390 [Serpula lacrymans var. lacrymans S7.3]|uniref:Uncharacterized protein n=2 Tax=Serpula lacrymans var. lacrymans TaxID=341189 RepID=F8QH89_SERL3|nr:hypothetical protein SERLA73DRAFT_147390 [Serpula lacrymans var. lacrymans S7.3]
MGFSRLYYRLGVDRRSDLLVLDSACYGLFLSQPNNSLTVYNVTYGPGCIKVDAYIFVRQCKPR